MGIYLIDIVGFSRGAASARMFADKVQRIMSDGVWYGSVQTLNGDPNAKHLVYRKWEYTTELLKNCGIHFNFNFMGLYDTVPAYGLAQNNDMENLSNFDMSLDVTNSAFKTIVHAVAVNENRYQFSRRSIYEDPTHAKSQNGVMQSSGKYRLEKGFMGAHSDIGGGYANGDLSNASLMWMIKQAEEKGSIKFKDYSQYNQINNPIVHDSVMALPVPIGRLAYTPGSEFRWANDSSYGYSSRSIFNNYDHLTLNWNDTKVFQNPNYKKFDDVEKITNLYMKNPNARYANYPGMLADPSVHAILQLYKYQKDLGKDKPLNHIPIFSTEDRNVLMANEENKMIRLNDYLTWLNCNYGLSLDTNIDPKTDKSLPDPYPDMDMCTNLGIKYSK